MLAGILDCGSCEDLRDSQKNTSSRSESAQKVRGNRESTNASTTEGSGSRDNTLKLLVHALLAVTGHDQTLLLQLLGNITRAGAGDLNPGLGEDGAGTEHVDDVDSGVDGVEESVGKVEGGRHVVSETGDGEQLGGTTLLGLPDSQKANEEVVAEAAEEHLGNQEDVRAQGRLQHDGHVAGVEEADGVGSASSAVTRGLDGDLDTEALEVDDRGKDNKGGQEVHDVGQVLAVESLAERMALVTPGDEEMEKRDDGTLKLGATASVDGGRRERLPDNALANVGSDEKRDTRSQAISLLEKLVQENDNQTSDNELENEEQANTGAKVARLAVETSQNVDGSLSEGENDGENCGVVNF